MNQLIEQARLAQVIKALNYVFQKTIPDAISVLAGGGSTAQMYQFKINHKQYVLRLMGLDQSIGDRRIQVEALFYGAKLGIAPQCHYADAEQGLIIMDYIQQLPLTQETILQQMPSLLKKLHYSEQISAPFYPIFPYMNEFIDRINKITSAKPINDYFKSIQELMLTLNTHRQSAACHNDLNSENILYDGNQLYLIDFEAAGQEDPYFDLATVCQQNCFTSNEELIFLTAYLGEKPSPFALAKLYLMKQISYAYHALHFFQHAYDEGVMDYHDKTLALQHWFEGRKKGIYALDHAADFMLYAMTVLNQSLSEMASPAFINAKKLME